jgi:hypothetical protein
MGIFPSVETLLAQLLLLVLFAFALLKTFWPTRSVTLPTVPVLQADSPELRQILERLDAIEQKLSRH